MPVAVASAQEDGEDGAIFIPKIAANGRGAEGRDGEDGGCRLYMSAELEETVRKSQQLIERICEVNGVTARSPTMAGAGLDVARVEAWSEEGHQGCAVLAEYLQKRAQLESTYAQGLQKLNRGALQGLKEAGAAGDPRLNALLVYGEKTAAGHASLAQRVASARVVEGLRGLVQGAEQERRGLLGAVREGRGRWKRAVLAFDKVRQGCEKSVRAEAAACSACRAASERGQQLSASHVRRVRDAYERARAKALDARATFAEAREALRQEHRAVFGRALPECFRGLERLERARLGAVRAALLGVAEGQLAVAQAEAGARAVAEDLGAEEAAEHLRHLGLARERLVEALAGAFRRNQAVDAFKFGHETARTGGERRPGARAWSSFGGARYTRPPCSLA